jgi:hypothetical protein
MMAGRPLMGGFFVVVGAHHFVDLGGMDCFVPFA